ncbi:hypothetical protein B0T24DRAFT_580592 [Lasiosphaeria ovina]|uniref:Uncharacterized protein n=1 Tax=Lasiosphaeria ovina TaxID=92902 RepID=A0AAE0K440_9PEZI|nr:hypothetical protein B0T24DRAFT_580592 [Lasiosphaeria ovina]
MAIFPGGGPARSTAVNSPRHLTIRHARRLFAVGEQEQRALQEQSPAPTVAAPISALSLPAVRNDEVALFALEASAEASANGSDHDDDPDPVVLPGEEKVYSYWAPGLEAGQKHHVKVSQTIEARDEKLPLSAEKVFFVDAPQFSLPQGTVHSVYPPQGYSDDNRILPHIVLTDPHLPWERLGSPKAEASRPARPRNQVPWLVLFSFTQNELMLPPEDLNGPNTIFSGTTAGVIKPVKQSTTLTVSMSIADLWNTTKSGVVATPITDQLGPDGMKNTRGDFIFVKPDLFTSLFSNFDEDGVRKVPGGPNTTPYSLLAHVRYVNGAGMALAGVEDTAVFSIVIGNRAGPLDNPTPVTVSVHLVSIEGVEDMKFPLAANAKYVALCSLHSWNYTVNPPGMVNVRESFESLGSTLDVLRMPETWFEKLEKGSKAQLRVAARLRDGYSLVKHRLQSGEQTVAFFRGPFTPTVVNTMNPIHDRCSNSGVDLQILDSDLGIMDITYSAAWQLGRTLALGDEGFTTALGRLRTSIRGTAMRQAKKSALTDINGVAYRGREEVLRGLPDLHASLSAISSSNNATSPPPEDTDTARDRWLRPRLPRSDIPNLSFSSPVIREKYPMTALSAAEELGESADGDVYDELNDPASTDWRIVLTWLLGRMYLDGVPAHYLITDPSYLPQESLRFFYIDPNWVDALLDGALSLGNHMGLDEDRVAIKKALNRYITNTPKHLDFTPQIPTYGFYLRSDLVSMFPDLRVTTLPDRPQLPPGVKDRAPLLRHDIITDGVMLGLLDRVPGTSEFNGLVLTQPPHQQRFAVAPGLDTKETEIHIRRQYTVNQATRLQDKDRHKSLEPPTVCNRSTKDPLFIWGSSPDKNDLRIMRLQRFAQAQLDMLNGPSMPTYRDGNEDKKYFKDDTRTSALFAMQLSDPVYNLTIKFGGAVAEGKLKSLMPPPLPDAPLTAARVLPMRTLRSLQPPEIQRLPAAVGAGPSKPSDDESSEEESSEEESSEEESSEEESNNDGEDNNGADRGTMFQRRPDYTQPAHEFMSAAPHIPNIPIIDLPVPAEGLTTTATGVVASSSTRVSRRAPAPMSFMAVSQLSKDSSGRDPATAPRFDCKLHTRGVNSGIIEIPADASQQLRQDIVFTVQAFNNDNDEWDLVELDILIPLGPAPTTIKQPYFLMERYEGTGATMLANLRFNVVMALVTPGNKPYLQLRVLPRASKGFINITKVQDISFLLALVNVNRWVGGPGDTMQQINITTKAYYMPKNSPPRVKDDVLVTVTMVGSAVVAG